MSNPIYADFHVHTHLSPCARPEATAEALIRRAEEKGIAALGFADHFTPRSIPGCAFYNHQRLSILDDLQAEIAGIFPRARVDLLVGVEADYTLAGETCIDAETLSSVDHVVCAASHFHLPAAPCPADDTPRAKADLMLDMARKALVLPGVSIWAHPFDCSRMRPLSPILDTIANQELIELIALAKAHEVAIEINGGPAIDRAYREATTHFFCMAREMNARFTITADAHHPNDLERLDLALEWASKMGFQDENFVTAHELCEKQGRKIT